MVTVARKTYPWRPPQTPGLSTIFALHQLEGDGAEDEEQRTQRRKRRGRSGNRRQN